MLIYDLFITLLSPFGLETFILLPSDLINYINFANVSEWYHLLNIQFIFSSIVYMSFIWGMYFVFCVIPFRFFLKLIRVPKRGGK